MSTKYTHIEPEPVKVRHDLALHFSYVCAVALLLKIQKCEISGLTGSYGGYYPPAGGSSGLPNDNTGFLQSQRTRVTRLGEFANLEFTYF
jgi:hypothetical protein